MSTPMNPRARFLVNAMSVVAMFALVPLAAAAQSGASFASRAGDALRAEEAHRKATVLLSTQDRGRWPEVARLLEKAAGLRAFEDTIAVQEREQAAEMLASLGSLPEAQQDLEDAADQALRNGMLLRAAQLFVKAAYAADARGYAAEAKAHLRAAQLLAASPHLTQEECDCIHQRIVGATRSTNPADHR